MDVINLGTAEGLPPVDWSAIEEKLETRVEPRRGDHNAFATFLTTLNEDGRPHTSPVGAIWVDGQYFFQTGSTRKGRNLDRDPRCSIAAATLEADVVVEGDAERVTDAEVLARITKVWTEGGWPVEPDPSGTGVTAPFNAPAQGPPPWHVYRLDARSAVVTVGAEPGGLCRFNF